mmetsp:Transcript_26367/g.51946  ORF Transcript_26367/g.51946 Transcript_26367/m.51946 type:complete len:846 (-) Transcript_26367:262-2799(-)|eukprot:CAMPEP_0175138184 /NCGR_PEP_ID=MMETSP0087-20121206/10208_1 /TAXON_ID=136419 /ORGANISM="Unknown Unknown, Strain D1" /LENGTH=845 /DNA_ID=CAMNT_0016421059 /DNA_START=134 /DNA_END=2671 /DNA_ORIENTATION=-
MPLTRAQRAAAADPAMKPRESVRDRLAQWKQLKEQNAALLNKAAFVLKEQPARGNRKVAAEDTVEDKENQDDVVKAVGKKRKLTRRSNKENSKPATKRAQWNKPANDVERKAKVAKIAVVPSPAQAFSPATAPSRNSQLIDDFPLLPATPAVVEEEPEPMADETDNQEETEKPSGNDQPTQNSAVKDTAMKHQPKAETSPVQEQKKSGGGSLTEWKLKCKLLESSSKALQAEIEVQQKKYTSKVEEHKELEKSVSQLEAELKQIKSNQEAHIEERVQAQLEQASSVVENQESDSSSKVIELQEEIARLEKEHKATIREVQDEAERTAAEHIQELSDEQEVLKHRIQTVETDLAQAREKAANLETENSQLKEEIAQARSQAERIAELEQMLAQSEKIVEEMQLRKSNGEKLRKKLHNQVQDLKGNIRVMCRIRPLKANMKKSAFFSSMAEAEASVMSAIDLAKAARLSLSANHVPGEDEDDNMRVDPHAPVYESREGKSATEVCDILDVKAFEKGLDLSYKEKNTSFKFDKVFGETSTQQDLFDSVSDLVTSCIDGHNVTVFAYGQTGSGKTHTMMGPSVENICENGGVGKQAQANSKWGSSASEPVRSNKRGVIPRTMEQVFSAIADLESNDWRYSLRAAYLEIYNDEVRDLLYTGSEGARAKLKMGILNGQTCVTGLTIKDIGNITEVYSLLEMAINNRTMGQTACNDRSSRSHTVFQLFIDGQHRVYKKQKVSSSLNLVDLAGSERVSIAQTTGQQKKETAAINRSLSALVGCIAAIGNKQKHVPFRDSKITQLLQHSLSGSGKTLFFINISPEPQHQNETLCTLRFAEALRGCELSYRRTKK